jgi:CcmD family protein
MSNEAWLVVGLLAVCVGLGGYVASLHTRRRALRERLERLGRR